MSGPAKHPARTRLSVEALEDRSNPAFGPAGTCGGPALYGTLHEAAPWQDAFSA